MISDPDGRAAPEGGWREVCEAVLEAVRVAQSYLRDSIAECVMAQLHQPMESRQRMIVEMWLGYDHPEFDPPHAQVVNGRHRTWGAKSAGLEATPVLNSSAFDAIFAWHADPEVYRPVDADTLTWWREDRAWWDSDAPEAAEWKAINAEHLALWDQVLESFQVRLDAEGR